MVNIRIIEIPKIKAVYSGPLTDAERFTAFNKWFSEYHASLKCELYPRDFMWYNERLGAQEWFYALPRDAEKDLTGGWAHASGFMRFPRVQTLQKLQISRWWICRPAFLPLHRALTPI